MKTNENYLEEIEKKYQKQNLLCVLLLIVIVILGIIFLKALAKITKSPENTLASEAFLLRYYHTADKKCLEEAVELCKKVHKKSPYYSFNNYILTYCYETMGDIDNANRIFQSLSPYEQATYKFFFRRPLKDVANYLKAHLRPFNESLAFPATPDGFTRRYLPSPYYYPCFHQISGRYFSPDRWNYVLGSEGEKIIRFEEIMDLLEIKKGMTVADIGCGPGHFIFPLARRVEPGKVYGVEIEQCFLDFINIINKDMKCDNIVLVKSIPNNITLPGNLLDFALLFNVYRDISNHDLDEYPENFQSMVKPFLSSIYQSLKPTGRMVITSYMLDEYHPKTQNIIKDANHCGFKLYREIDKFLPVQSTLIFEKK